MSYRKVDNEYLDYFRFSLTMLKHNPTNESIEKLINYYDKNILQEEKAEINNLKRVLYSLMTRYKKIGDMEKSKRYYNLYQDFKSSVLTYDEVLNKFTEI